MLAFHIGILIGYMLIAFGEELVGGITGSPVGRNHPYRYCSLHTWWSYRGFIPSVLHCPLHPLHSPDWHCTTPVLVWSNSIGLTVLIFIGVAFMNLSDDFMLIPSRALLNDKLPAPQLEHGNAFFGFIQALGNHPSCCWR